LSKRNWTLEHSQAEDVYRLGFDVHRAPWRHRPGAEPFRLGAGVEVFGTLEQFEQLATDILADCAAIRAEEGQTP
jgi:hypothetical protein